MSDQRIISASRRTDIPAFYAEWFINRVREGFCTVPNPFNRNQVARVSLRPADVAAIVFWTRHAKPLMRHLDELDRMGFRYYFQYTVMDNPREIDPRSPPLEVAIRTFRELADRIGPQRVIWRYDPIVLTTQTGVDFHLRTYRRIADVLKVCTRRSVVSIVDPYRKAQERLRELEKKGFRLDEAPDSEKLDPFMLSLAQAATEHDLEIFSCAEDIDLRPSGIQPGKCVDDAYLWDQFKIRVTNRKDKSQRDACGCVESKDIGMYDTCPFGCQYCYATTSFAKASENRKSHDPKSPSLVGWYEASTPTKADAGPKGGDQISLDL